jgi:hypothetical protein
MGEQTAFDHDGGGGLGGKGQRFRKQEGEKSDKASCDVAYEIRFTRKIMCCKM